MISIYKEQFDRVVSEGWLAHFQASAGLFGFPVEILIGIASRETNCRNIVGDGGHGYGLMQIDDRSYPKWCASGKWREPARAIAQGAYVLNSKRRWIARRAGLVIRFQPGDFYLPVFHTAQVLERLAIASYNAGLWPLRDFSHSRFIDLHTTGRNYSADVLVRASTFRKFLAAVPQDGTLL